MYPKDSEFSFDETMDEWSDNPMDYDDGDSGDSDDDAYGDYNPNSISSVSVVFIY